MRWTPSHPQQLESTSSKQESSDLSIVQKPSCRIASSCSMSHNPRDPCHSMPAFLNIFRLWIPCSYPDVNNRKVVSDFLLCFDSAHGSPSARSCLHCRRCQQETGCFFSGFWQSSPLPRPLAKRLTHFSYLAHGTLKEKWSALCLLHVPHATSFGKNGSPQFSSTVSNPSHSGVGNKNVGWKVVHWHHVPKNIRKYGKNWIIAMFHCKCSSGAQRPSMLPTKESFPSDCTTRICNDSKSIPFSLMNS